MSNYNSEWEFPGQTNYNQQFNNINNSIIRDQNNVVDYNKYNAGYELKYNRNNIVDIPRQPTTHLNNNYPIKQDEKISILAEPDVKYADFSAYVGISSNNRDSTKYPLHYNYRIDFNTIYRNVRKIELISAIIPNQTAASSGGSILNESSLIVDLDELNFIDFPVNNTSITLKGFAILPLKGPNQASGGFINPELGCVYHKSRVFKTPLAKLSHLNVRIRDSEGNLYDFGQTAGSTAKAYQNHFVFKLTFEESDVKQLQRKNVF